MLLFSFLQPILEWLFFRRGFFRRCFFEATDFFLFVVFFVMIVIPYVNNINNLIKKIGFI